MMIIGLYTSKYIHLILMSDALLRISFGGEISNCSVITYGKPTFQFEFNDMD